MKLLTRRWCGVSGLAVVMALLVGVLAWWLLPPRPFVHRWTFDGVAIVQEFRKDGEVIVCLFHDDSSTRAVQLDLASGASQQFLQEPDRTIHPRTLCGYELSHTLSHNDTATLTLKEQATSEEEKIIINHASVWIDDMYVGTTMNSSAKVGLATVGYAAMSTDQRWLLVQSAQQRPWASFIDGLESVFHWKPSFVPMTQHHYAHVLDRQNGVMTRHDLQIEHSPTFIVHPNNLGFLAISFDGNMVVPKTPNPVSTISWYPLPPNANRRTLGQWCTVGVLTVVPILLSWLRRKRIKVTVPAGAAG
jgi:hypothetical protein